MIELIKDYLNELLYKARDLALDCQLDLKDSECVGDWRLEVEYRLDKAKDRIKELEDSIKFLNKAQGENSNVSDNEKSQEISCCTCGKKFDSWEEFHLHSEYDNCKEIE